MLILFDIGNTSATYGIYQGGRFKAFGNCLYKYIPKIIIKCSRSGAKEPNIAVISSVVPKITRLVEMACKLHHVCPVIVDKHLSVPMKLRYRNPRKLGSDRKVNLYGALRIYKPPFLMIDYGTAIKADYVSKKGVFEGGMIIPGPETAFQALILRAALLPKKARLPKADGTFIGRSTYECLRAGVIHGYAAMTDGLIQRFRERYGKRLKVIATGGFLEHLRPHLRSVDVFDPRHSIKSLLILYKDSLKKR